MQVKNPDHDPLTALPALLPPPELEATVLQLSLATLADDAGQERTAPERTPSVSGFEIFVHGTLVAAYAVYAVHLAIAMLDRVLPF